MEREKKIERIKTSREYERKSCHKMVVQISFLYHIYLSFDFIITINLFPFGDFFFFEWLFLSENDLSCIHPSNQ